MPVFSPSLPDLRVRLETQVDFLNQVSHHAIDTVKQLSDLNLHMARQLQGDGIRLGRALASCSDPLQMGSVMMREFPLAAEAWRNWHSSLMSVLTASGATRPGVEDMGAAHNAT